MVSDKVKLIEKYDLENKYFLQFHHKMWPREGSRSISSAHPPPTSESHAYTQYPYGGSNIIATPPPLLAR